MRDKGFSCKVKYSMLQRHHRSAKLAKSTISPPLITDRTRAVITTNFGATSDYIKGSSAMFSITIDIEQNLRPLPVLSLCYHHNVISDCIWLRGLLDEWHHRNLSTLSEKKSSNQRLQLPPRIIHSVSCSCSRSLCGRIMMNGATTGL